MKSIVIVFVFLHILLLTNCQHKRENPVTTSITLAEDSINPIQRLIDGNNRFMSGHPIHPDESLERIRELKKGQHPFAVIVSCSDSRVPPELVFDQGLGDLFTIRTAGNVIGDYELGSIEYAIEHAKAKLVVVLGHENCGALTAFINHKGCKTTNHDHIESILKYISEEKEIATIPDSLKTNINYAVNKNVLHGVNFLSESEPILAPLVNNKKIQIIGAIYDLDTGKVNFVNF